MIKNSSSFEALKPNLTKHEIASSGGLKWVKVAISGTKCVDLTENSIKVLGVFYLYNEILKMDNFFDNYKKY